MNQEIFEQRKKTIYGLICDELYVPMKIKEMAILLNLPREKRGELEEILAALLEEGKIEISKKGKYSKAEGKFVTGKFIGNPRGFGFVELAEGEDIFISENQINGAMHGDEVQVVLMPGKTGKRQEGSIVKILTRATTKLVGTFERNKNFGFVIPDNQKFGQDVFVPLERSKGAVSGHKVVVELTDYGKKDKKPEGKVIEIIGHINDPGTDIMSIIKGYDLPLEFSDKVLKQAETVAKPVSGADMAGRMDLRDWQTVTIDGEDQVYRTSGVRQRDFCISQSQKYGIANRYDQYECLWQADLLCIDSNRCKRHENHRRRHRLLHSESTRWQENTFLPAQISAQHTPREAQSFCSCHCDAHGTYPIYGKVRLHSRTRECHQRSVRKSLENAFQSTETVFQNLPEANGE